jgi:hypothetical protein
MITPSQPNSSPHAHPARFFGAPILWPTKIGNTQTNTAKTRSSMLLLTSSHLAGCAGGRVLYRPGALRLPGRTGEFAAGNDSMAHLAVIQSMAFVFAQRDDQPPTVVPVICVN